MNKTIIILLFCLSTELIFAQSGGGISINHKQNEITPDYFIQGIPDSVTSFSLQGNLFPLTIIPKDHYNSGVTSVSAYPLIRAIGFLGFAFLGSNGKEMPGIFPDSSFTLKLFRTLGTVYFVTTGLTTSQFHLSIFGYDTLDYSSIRSSLFVGTQTAYFISRNVNWWRIGFESGLEFQYDPNSYNQTNKIFNKHSIGLQFGISLQWDLVQSNSNRMTEYFICIKYFM